MKMNQADMSTGPEFDGENDSIKNEFDMPQIDSDDDDDLYA